VSFQSIKRRRRQQSRQVFIVQIVAVVNSIYISRFPTGILVSFKDKNPDLDFIVVVAIVRCGEYLHNLNLPVCLAYI